MRWILREFFDDVLDMCNHRKGEHVRLGARHARMGTCVCVCVCVKEVRQGRERVGRNANLSREENWQMSRAPFYPKSA